MRRSASSTTIVAAAVILTLAGLALAQQPSGAAPASVPVSAAPSSAVLLEKGIYTEETVGDLDAAIKLYQQIVNDAKANRQYGAQAQYRLAMCYLKKKQSAAALQALQAVVADFADQKELVAQAAKKIGEVRQGMSEADVAKIVEDVVTDISTMADGDPKIPGLLQSLRELKEPVVVKELATYLASDKNTIRRAAIYIFWKAGFSDAAPAVPAMIKLCSHDEDLTRGMTALALGELKADAAFDKLADMLANDKSSFARRCAAYALGLLGNAQAKPILEKALKDPDQFVGNNAEAALTMLAKRAAGSASSPKVVKTAPAAFANEVEASVDKITVTFDRPMKDKSWSFTSPDKAFTERTGAVFPERSGEIAYDAARTTCTMPVKLAPGKVYWVGVNSPSHRNFVSADGTPAADYQMLFATKSADGKPTPLPQDLVAEAEAINSNIATRPAAPGAEKWPLPQVGPAPWNDGETTTLMVNTKTGFRVGMIQYEASLVPKKSPATTSPGASGGPSALVTQGATKDSHIWRLESYTVVPMQDYRQYTRVDADVPTLAPIDSLTRNTLGDFATTYSRAKAAIAVRRQGKQTTQEVDVPKTVFDNEEVLFMLRCLPLKEGYRAAFPILSTVSGAALECRIAVVGTEKVTCASGEIKCYTTNLAVFSGETKVLEHQICFSADEHRYLVRYDAQTAVMEALALGGSKRQTGTEPWAVAPAGAVTLQRPVGWVFYLETNPGVYKYSVQLLPPQLQGWGLLSAMAAPPETTARNAAEADAVVVGKFFKNYAVRKDSWTDVKVGSLAGASYIADYQDNGVPMVEYRTYLLGDLLYWFVFRHEKADFDARKAQYDAVIKGLSVTPAIDQRSTSAPEGKIVSVETIENGPASQPATGSP